MLVPCITGLYVIQIHTRCTISTGMRNSTEANSQIKYINLQLRNRTESCEEVQNKIIKSNPNPVKQNLSKQNPSQS